MTVCNALAVYVHRVILAVLAGVAAEDAAQNKVSCSIASAIRTRIASVPAL